MPLKAIFSLFKNKSSDSIEPQWPEDRLPQQQQAQNAELFRAQYAQITDPQESFDLCKQAADEGVVEALYLLGVMYENGDGQQQYLQQAAECYWRAGSKGKAEAQYSLALIYAQGSLGQQDYLTAFHWFEKAADAGIPEAQYNLANCHDQALGCLGDKAKAFNWYMKAAEQGVIAAWQNIAVMYYNGEGIEKDIIRAYGWTLLGAKAGQKESITSEKELTAELSADQIIEGKALFDKLTNQYQSFMPVSNTDNE